MQLRRAFERAGGSQVVPEASKGLWDRDDFTTKLASSFNQSAGGAHSAVTSIDSNHTTCIVDTVTAVGDAARIVLENAAMASFFFGGGEFYVEVVGFLNALSDGVNNIVVRVGMGDVTGTGDFVDGVYFEYDFATNGNHLWYLCTANNSVRTKTSLGYVPVAGQFQRLRATVNAAGTSVVASIDGVPVGSPNTTNIPLQATRSCGVEIQSVKQLGAGALMTTWDYWEVKQLYTVAR